MTSLREQALLVSLSCSAFYPNVKCQEARRVLTKASGGDEDTASVMRLFGGRKSDDREILLEPIRVMRQAQDEIHRCGTPFIRQGGDIIPTDLIPDLKVKLESRKDEFDRAVDVVEDLFTNKRDGFLEREKARHKKLFNTDNYPHSVKSLYSWEFNVSPLPEGDHNVIQMSDDAAKYISDDIRETHKRWVTGALDGFKDRFVERLNVFEGILERYVRDEDGRLTGKWSSAHSHVMSMIDTGIPLLKAFAEEDTDGQSDRIEAVVLQLNNDIGDIEDTDIKSDDETRLFVLGRVRSALENLGQKVEENHEAFV